jgi:glycosyltransferase involved in cell wall biosynthesis
MSIKVLHIIDHLGYGGAPIVVKNIVERLDGGSIETFVCALRTNPEAIPIETNLISLTHHKYNPFSFLSIAKLCKTYNIDIVHAHLQKSIISSLLAGFLCNAKIIIHEHGPIFRRGTGCIYRLLLKLLASKASAAIANSQATKSALQKITQLPEESIYVVSNFIDLSRFDRTLYDRNKIRNSLGIADNETAVGFLGRLDQCKGIDLLIHAAEILCKKDPNYRFIITGRGAQGKSLEQLAFQLGLQEKISFTGLCKNPAEIMAAFDIAVIPSRREAFGITAVEFMKMKVPVIASPVGGLVELIQNKKTGILLENLTAANIAQAVIELAQDDSLRKSITENAEVFSRAFDGQQQLKQITEIYEKFVI